MTADRQCATGNVGLRPQFHETQTRGQDHDDVVGCDHCGQPGDGCSRLAKGRRGLPACSCSDDSDHRQQRPVNPPGQLLGLRSLRRPGSKLLRPGRSRRMCRAKCVCSCGMRSRLRCAGRVRPARNLLSADGLRAGCRLWSAPGLRGTCRLRQHQRLPVRLRLRKSLPMR